MNTQEMGSGLALKISCGSGEVPVEAMLQGFVLPGVQGGGRGLL